MPMKVLTKLNNAHVSRRGLKIPMSSAHDQSKRLDLCSLASPILVIGLPCENGVEAHVPFRTSYLRLRFHDVS